MLWLLTKTAMPFFILSIFGHTTIGGVNMKQEQLQFQEFLLSKVHTKDISTVKQLLQESFTKQKEGSFDEKYLQSFITKITPLLKEEDKEEVVSIMKHYQIKKG